MRIYRPVASIQGNRMCDPGITKYGPPCKTRRLALKWIKANGWERYGVTYVKSETVVEAVE